MARLPRAEIVAQLREEREDLAERLTAVDLALKAFGVDPARKRRASRAGKSNGKRTANEEVVKEVMRVLTELAEPGTMSEVYTLGHFNGRSQASVRDQINASDKVALNHQRPGRVWFTSDTWPGEQA